MAPKSAGPALEDLSTARAKNKHTLNISSLAFKPYKATIPTDVMPKQQRIDPARRIQLQSIIEWEKSQGRVGFHATVFRHVGVSNTQGWKILHDFAHPEENAEDKPETRGRKALLTPDDIYAVEEAIKEHAWDVKTMSWDAIVKEVLDSPCSGNTLQRTMKVMNHFRCISCSRGWVHPNLARERVDFAQAMLQWKPSAGDWQNVRFSDTLHVMYGPRGRARVTRRPGERLCKNCIQGQSTDPIDEDKWDTTSKRAHAWISAGQGFKSPIVIYDISKSNGKMTLQAYKDDILEPIVKPWLMEVRLGIKQPFILAEDQDFNHGNGHCTAWMQTWKKDNGLQYYFNCQGSPDLTPIGHCWQTMTQYFDNLQKPPEYSEHTVRDSLKEGWGLVDQDSINVGVMSMPDRLQKCIEMEGQYIGM